MEFRELAIIKMSAIVSLCGSRYAKTTYDVRLNEIRDSSIGYSG